MVSKAQEAKWKAEGDFRTLASAEEIKSDKGRLSKAKAEGRKIVKDEKKVLNAKERIVAPTPRKAAPARRRR